MTVWYKQGVTGDPTRQMLKGRNRIHGFYKQYFSEDLYITSIRDGNHSAGSLHYRGDAEDYRYPSRPMEPEDMDALRSLLGKDYDIVFHDSHIHVEYDPK